MNLWNEDKNHGIRQHDTLVQDMTFSCHLIFQHSAVVQFENNLGVQQFWHRSIFFFHLTLSHSSVYEVCSSLFFGNDQYIHIFWQFCYHPSTLLWLLGRLCYHHPHKMRCSKVHASSQTFQIFLLHQRSLKQLKILCSSNYICVTTSILHVAFDGTWQSLPYWYMLCSSLKGWKHQEFSRIKFFHLCVGQLLHQTCFFQQHFWRLLWWYWTCCVTGFVSLVEAYSENHTT